MNRVPYSIFCIAAAVFAIAAGAAAGEFPDPGLEEAIRETLGVPQPLPISDADLESITFLDASFREIVDLTGIERLVELDSLFLFGNESLSDISLLAEVVKLRKLFIFSCDLSHITPLADLPVLTELHLQLNSISDLNPLRDLTTLTFLNVEDNLVEDISPLIGLSNLVTLEISSNAMTNIDALAALTGLETLEIAQNFIDNIDVLALLPNLHHIDISGNEISDIGPLAANTSLTENDRVDIRQNPLNDDAYDTQIPALLGRNIDLLFDERQSPDDFTLRLEIVAEGFQRPVYVTAPPGDPERLIVLEQHTGLLLLIKNGVKQERPYLDCGGRISTDGNERGLLGLAFHPGYASNGLFFVSYTDSQGASVVERFSVSPDLDVADDASGVVAIGPIAQPFTNHNGGMIAFGPDGYLYLGLGDGGSTAGDPNNLSQDLGELHGKMLRVDVDRGLPAPGAASNPFFEMGGNSELIWSYGLRNPWRFSFDRLTGGLYIGDVGQNIIEELSFQPAGSPGGENYGWNILEGDLPFRCPEPLTGADCDTIAANSVRPILTYDHVEGRSITGGYVYRGSAITSLQGTYFFADFVTARIWSFRYDGTTMTELVERSAEFVPREKADSGFLSKSTRPNVSSFGEDAAGELYLVDFTSGRVLKIISPDSDGDGLNDADETAWGYDRDDSDTDDDGLPDGWEHDNGLDPASAAGENGAEGDGDGDGFTNLQEYQNGTDPNRAGSVGVGCAYAAAPASWDGWILYSALFICLVLCGHRKPRPE